MLPILLNHSISLSVSPQQVCVWYFHFIWIISFENFQSFITFEMF